MKTLKILAIGNSFSSDATRYLHQLADATGIPTKIVNLYIGGGIINLEERIEVDDEYKEKGSFNLAYVREARATLPTYLFSFIAGWDRESIKNIQIDENDNSKDMWKRQKLYLKEANDNAIINAYKLAGEEINIRSEIYQILYLDKNAETNLEIGDEIISINSQKIVSYDDIKNIAINKNIDDEIIIKVKRNEKEYECYAKIKEIDNEKKIGIYLIKLYDYEVKRDIDLSFSKREGGSSGGFMLSLAIYNRLIEKDITNGLKIVGTGTIDSEGNVGEIGGVKYKLKGAVKNKADIFFVPKNNYQEALSEKQKNKYKIDIVKVDTLKDAINYLESR